MNKKNGLVWLALMLAWVFMLAIPDLAYATSNTPMGNVLCTTVAWFTGNTGKGLATLAIAIVGVWKLLGKISGKAAILTAVGIAVLFAAGTIVETMGGGAPVGCTTS